MSKEVLEEERNKLMAVESSSIEHLAVAVDGALRTTLRKTTTETLMEALIETADRMKRGVHSPLDHLLVSEAATRFGEILKG